MSLQLSSPVPLPPGPAGLLPIVTSKTIKAKDGSVSQKLRLDVEGFTLNQIRDILVSIATEEIAAQIRIDNPPAFANVDGVRGRGIAQVQRRMTVSFGNRLKMSALATLKNTLKAAIDQSTERITGRLADMSNWQFRYVRNGALQALPLSGASGIPMGPNDFIVLMPTGVRDNKGRAYATAVNMRVAGAGKLSFKRSAKGRVSRRNQAIGYLALASRVAATSQEFAGFNVLSGFTSKHPVAGEVLRQFGVRTGFIKISAKRGKR